MPRSGYTIKPPSKTSFLRNIGKSKDDFIKPTTTGGIGDILYAFGVDLLDDLARKLNEINKVDTGSLIESMKFAFNRFGTDYEFTFSLNEYYKWVDKGRKKGKGAPPQVILDWVKRTGLQPKTLSNIKSRKTFKAKDQETLAFLINRSIKRHGIKPTHFFTKTVEDGRIKTLSKDLSKALGKEVKIDILKYIDEIKKK